MSASCVQLAWRTHTHVRATIDLLSSQHVRVRFDSNMQKQQQRQQFEVRRATPQRVLRELVEVMRRDVPDWPRIDNVFQIDFDLLERDIVPLSSPLERAMLCGALVSLHVSVLFPICFLLIVRIFRDDRYTFCNRSSPPTPPCAPTSSG